MWIRTAQWIRVFGSIDSAAVEYVWRPADRLQRPAPSRSNSLENKALLSSQELFWGLRADLSIGHDPIGASHLLAHRGMSTPTVCG
jgi:hypothetical protein